MPLTLKEISLVEYRQRLNDLPDGKLLINTINAHSYNTALKDPLFAEALLKGDALIPDGAGIVMACKWLSTPQRPLERIAGLFRHHVALEVLDIGEVAFVGNGIKTVIAVQPIAGDLLLHGTVCVQDEIRGFFFLNGSIRREGRGSAAEEEKCGNRSRNGFCKILTHIDRDPFSESIMPFSR